MWSDVQAHEITMYESKEPMWFQFAAWLALAVLAAFGDRAVHRSLFLPIFMVSSFLITVIAARKHRPRNYKFEWIRPGVVRSPLGFEVRVSGSRLEYVETNHVISWQSPPAGASVVKIDLSENGISGWDSPFSEEPLERTKKTEIANAMRSAISYLQLVDAGKIRPKTP